MLYINYKIVVFAQSLYSAHIKYTEHNCFCPSAMNKCNFIFLLFSCMCFWQLSSSRHSASLSIRFNLMTIFSGTRSMGFHQSGWFFWYRTNRIRSIWLIFQVADRIPLIWSLKFQNALHLSTLSINWTELHFWPQQRISRKKKTQKITFKKLFFPTWKLTLFRQSPIYKGEGYVEDMMKEKLKAMFAVCSHSEQVTISLATTYRVLHSLALTIYKICVFYEDQ